MINFWMTMWNLDRITDFHCKCALPPSTSRDGVGQSADSSEGSDTRSSCVWRTRRCPAVVYREVNKGSSVVARNVILLLLNCSAWPCLGPA